MKKLKGEAIATYMIVQFLVSAAGLTLAGLQGNPAEVGARTATVNGTTNLKVAAQ